MDKTVHLPQLADIAYIPFYIGTDVTAEPEIAATFGGYFLNFRITSLNYA